MTEETLPARLRAAADVSASPRAQTLMREAATKIEMAAGHEPALEREFAELRATYKAAGGRGVLTMAKAKRAMRLFAETENEA